MVEARRRMGLLLLAMVAAAAPSFAFVVPSPSCRSFHAGSGCNSPSSSFCAINAPVRRLSNGSKSHTGSARRPGSMLLPRTRLHASSSPQPEVPPGPLDDRETKSKIDKEFVSIAIPAFIQFASEPLASLVNTMYLGRLGAVALGAAGIAISAQYSVSKLYNDPLLRTSISLVAAETKSGDASSGSKESSELSNRVSAALLLAFCIGIIQAAVFGLFSERIIELMGVSRSAEMFLPAIAFLKVKSLGAPGMTLWLVSNGIFRGLGDTVTPLKWASIFTLLNAVLDPFFIFTLNLGCPGAAMGTVAAQYIAVIPLLLKLHEKFHLQFSLSSLRSSLTSYLSSGSFVFIRTIGKVLTYFVCSREAALLGTVSSAAYNICFQLGTATTQICESISVASQSILARESTKDDVRRRNLICRHVIFRGVLGGALIASLLSLFTFLNQRHVLQGLTTDASVQAAAATIMPLVLWTQVSKGMAYPVNGMIMGAMDWKFLSASMWLCNFCCLGTIWYFKSQQTIGTIWIALCIFMSMQCVSGLCRIASKTGPWRRMLAN